VQKIFEQIPNPHLKGTLIWEPMIADDEIAAADTHQEAFQDSRVKHYWDTEKVLGKIVAGSMLRITPIAWDIYLLYQPGRHWGTKKFPTPDLWMHQLSENESLRLKPEVLQQKVMKAIDNLVN
jgi:hypothetical protein